METLQEENARLLGRVLELEAANARNEQRVKELERQVEQLLRTLEELRRGGKRQAAPFSRGVAKADPKRPGRKPGEGYGQSYRRAVPAVIDQVLEAELACRCPNCGGAIEEIGVESQYQTEIPGPGVERIQFRVHVGRCKGCGRRMQGRHPRQSSDAVGAAGSQLGPRAVALATKMNKGLGLSHGKTAELLETAFGLQVSRGGLAQAFARVARKAELTYEALIQQIRTAPSVTPDETGWKVGGKLWWMWAFSTAAATVYTIQPGRGYEQAVTVLGEDYDGFLVRDGWVVYRRFTAATHQTCLAHLLRRCREMLEVAPPHQTQLPTAVKEILQAGLELRDRRDQGQIGEQGLAIARGQLEARLDRVLDQEYEGPDSIRLANHLRTQREAIFPFLYCPGLGSHQLPRRTGYPSYGGHPQGLGRQPHSGRCSYPKRVGQHPTNLPPTTPLLHRLHRGPPPHAHSPARFSRSDVAR